MRTRLNVSIDKDVADEARALRLNVSHVAERALAEAIRQERLRLWRDENAAALTERAEWLDENGLPLADLQTWQP